MDYEKFKEELVNEVERQAGEEYQVSLQKVKKNNGISKNAVSISRKGRKVAPVIYIDSFYEKYQQGVSIVHLAASMLQHFQDLEESMLPVNMDFYSEYENVRENIYCKLINIGMNREILREIPYRTYLDLAVVYYYLMDMSDDGNATILINQKQLELWNLTGEELDRQAWENTVADLPASLRPMSEVLHEYLDTPETETKSPSLPMYVLTNEKKIFGAICIRYPGILKKLAEKLGGDFYILPSSVHECILVPVAGSVSRDALKEMVIDINLTQVEPQEILANQVYMYSRALDQIMF